MTRSLSKNTLQILRYSISINFGVFGHTIECTILARILSNSAGELDGMTAMLLVPCD